MRPWIRTIDSPAPASGLNHGHDQTSRSGGSGLLRRTGSFGTGWGSRRVVGPIGSGGGSTGRRELWAGWRGGTKGGSAGPFDRPGGNYRGEGGSVAVGGGSTGEGRIGFVRLMQHFGGRSCTDSRVEIAAMLAAQEQQQID
jgi:hypothetical protein